MGKFKDMHISMINSDFPIIDYDFSKFTDEEITNEYNKRVTVDKYILNTKNYVYEIVPINTKVHLWDWSDCRREIGAKLLYSQLEGNLIKSQVFETVDKIDALKLDDYNLKVNSRIK